jgi:hypothetical protein
MTHPRRRVRVSPNPNSPEPAVGEETQLLLKMFELQRDDFIKEREADRQSRARLHERVDGMAEDVGAIRGDIRLLGHVDEQIRDEVRALGETVETNKADVLPTVEAWRHLMANGRAVSWIFGIAGVTTVGGLVGVVTGVWDAVWSAVRGLGRF